jgi:hypothetical protein
MRILRPTTAGIAAELTLPESVTQHRHRFAAWCRRIGRLQRPAERGVDAQHVK